MYTFSITTLVDITNNGDLRKPFPFKTLSGGLVHDNHSLSIAKDQNNNFTTLIQLLQIRGNIVWKDAPDRNSMILNQNKYFGTHYEGKANVWHFRWDVEQVDVYSDFDGEDKECGNLVKDFDYVPIINFCKETITFPASAFITQDPKFKNTVFTYEGPSDK